MIITSRNGRLRFVTQSDHAHLAAEILRLWHTDGLPEHPRRDDLLLAAREHDNGWREHDAAPRVQLGPEHPDRGRPSGFRDISDADRRSIWQRGTARHADTHPYTALLILEHARALHRGLRDDQAWSEVLTGWDEQRAALLEQTFVPEAVLAADYAWIDLSDAVSLALAERWDSERIVRGVRIVPQPPSGPDDGDTLALAPFPLRGATTFALPCRDTEDRLFPSDSALTMALAEARWYDQRVRLVPLDLALR